MPPKRKYAAAISSRYQAAKKRRRTAAALSTTPSKTTTFVVPRGPIAPRTVVRLKYHDEWQSDGATIDYMWNLNSLFDPNRTGTGHQPLGFDQYTTFYNRYRVYKVRAILEAVAKDGNPGCFKVAMIPNNSISAFTDMTQACEQPDGRFQTVAYGRPLFMRGNYYLPRINGCTATRYKSDDRYQATMTASPAEQIVLHVCWDTMGDNAIAASGVVSFGLTLEFFCELFDPNMLNTS